MPYSQNISCPIHQQQMIIQAFNSFSKTRSGNSWKKLTQQRPQCISLHKVKTDYLDEQYHNSSPSFNNTQRNFANLDSNSFIRRAYHKINSRAHFKSFNEDNGMHSGAYQPQNRECSRHKFLLMKNRQRISTQPDLSEGNKSKRCTAVWSYNTNGGAIKYNGLQSQKLEFQLKKIMMLGQKRINKSFILNFKDKKKEERLNKVKEHVKNVRIRMSTKKIPTHSGSQGQPDDFRPWSNLSEHEDINDITEYR